MKRAAVFLDRDGTLNREVGYLSNPEDLVLLPGAAEAVRRINRAGMAAVVVTNQSGVARGFFDEERLTVIHERLRRDLGAAGAVLDGIYVCPHHPEGVARGYAVSCTCRKPAPGMVLRAARELDLDLPASYMVGDHLKDMRMGREAGLRSILVLTGYGRDQWEEAGAEVRSVAAYVAPDLSAAVDWILRDREGRSQGAGP